MPSPIQNLNLASNSAITTALTNLKGTYNGRNAWLNTSINKYIIDTSDEIKRDFVGGSINHPHMVNYLATSVFIHCFNGWSYLSGAISALMEGDYSNAIHNDYYSELRVILSFLASQGIGVFNGNNIVVDRHGMAHEVFPKKKRTHDFANEAFDEWHTPPLNTDTFLKSFTIDSSTLHDWIGATGFSAEAPRELIAAKLKQWSFDLTLLKKENKFRNFVSYNPQCFDLSLVRKSDNIQERLNFVIDVWKLCGPNNLFANSILRKSYETLYVSLFNMPLSELKDDTDWKEIFTDLGKNPNDQTSQSLIRFLTRQTNPNENLIFDYAESQRYSDPVLEIDTDPIGIISRACLIMLINTKIIETVLRQSGTSKEDLKFWFDNIGLKSGYWDAGAEPDLFSDLWIDVEIELGDIKRWIDNPATNFNPFNLKNNLKSSTTHIRSLGKACLWGIGL